MKAVVLAVALCMAVLGLPGDCPVAGRPVRLSGSTTMGPLMARLIRAYQEREPDRHFLLTGSGSAAGARDLALGLADVALLSREMNDPERAVCARNGVEPERFLLALDGLVPIVHPSNPLAGVTAEQLRAIYEGELRNWRELGGPSLAVVPLERGDESGSHDIWFRMVLGAAGEAAGLRRLDSNEAMVRAVCAGPGAIGYVGMGFVDGSVKALPLDGRTATVRSVLDGSYPASRTLNFYIAGDATQPVRAFVDFVLSSQGRRIVVESGFVPHDRP
ncbi:MAG: PstS family phosphate ABC transporter substrate-binding protein [Pseudodesulfovibrio sp.]|nr:PstS family phosphate ABC transporter substrate-binding protein [Pseudodesulfovibrio sp.]